MERNQEMEIQKRVREIYVWDTADAEWRRGRIGTLLVPRDPVVLVWTDTGANTDVAPDADIEIDVEYASRVAIQIDSTHPSNTSTDIDVNVMAYLDGGKWDTVEFDARNMGDGEVKTWLLNVGVRKIRLRLDNNDAGTTAYVRAIVKVVE